MTRRRGRAALLVLALAAPAAAGGCDPGGGDAAAATPAPAGARAAVVVELFTSQGCSSCPPADRLLTRLPGSIDGVLVLPLAFHVDYWDDLGWRDPFSSADWTARQKRYAAAIAGGHVYTPQLVVQGREDMVGSDRGAVEDAIRRAAARPPGGATISAVPAGAAGRDRLTVA